MSVHTSWITDFLFARCVLISITTLQIHTNLGTESNYFVIHVRWDLRNTVAKFYVLCQRVCVRVEFRVWAELRCYNFVFGSSDLICILDRLHFPMAVERAFSTSNSGLYSDELGIPFSLFGSTLTQMVWKFNYNFKTLSAL